MCLSIGTPKIFNFPFVPNGKLNLFRCPKFLAHYSLIVMCLNIGTLNNHHIPFGTNEQVVVLGVPKLRHFRVRKEVTLTDHFCKGYIFFYFILSHLSKELKTTQKLLIMVSKVANNMKVGKQI